MSIATQVNRVLLHLLYNSSQLLLSARLRDLLSQVVPKGVIHQVHIVVNRVIEYTVHDLLIILLNLFLQEPAPALVSGQDIRMDQQQLHLLLAQFLMAFQSLKSGYQVELLSYGRNI